MWRRVGSTQVRSTSACWPGVDLQGGAALHCVLLLPLFYLNRFSWFRLTVWGVKAEIDRAGLVVWGFVHLFLCPVKPLHCVGEWWLLLNLSFVKGHILVSVCVGEMVGEASGNLAGGTTPSVAWIYLLEDGSDWWMSNLFISCSGTGWSICRTRGLLKGQQSAGLGRVHSRLMKPRYLPNSYLLKG